MTAFGLHNGNVIIGRHCGVFESSHVDTCNRYYGYSFTFPNGTVITFPANSTTSMISCICSDDNCNVHDLPDVLPTTTTGPTMTTTFATTQTTTTTRPTTTTTTPTTTTRRTTTLPPGLHCYTCYSIEGVAGSLPACEDDGASMPSRNCGDEEDWGRQSIPSVSIFYDPAVAKDDRDGTLQNPKVLCGTGRGTWVNNGSSVVVRGCGLFESRYDNTCSRDYSWRVRYPNGTVLIEFPGNTSSALYTCFCSSNHCNGGSVMEVMVGMVMMCVLLSGFFG
ncbi:uncharacterized protein LOC118435808 [Folsomia candida]|uniref:uncharacterized protein LOC118435808 n=1 Tax=Folsomia candida TaxID=158441 RepID=UPI001604DDB0|nr:uncharacterized protein LOC118435808 [Folsomia candida]